MFSSSNRPSSALAEAQALHQHGRLQEAEASYARILAREPGNVAARYHLGLARLQRGDLEGGAAAMKQLFKLAPDHADAHFNLGRAYAERGDAAKALSHFQRVVRQFPKLAEGQFYLGLVLSQLNRHAEAIPAFKRAIALRPDLAEAHLNLGSAFNETGHHELAVACFERALELRPDFAEAHNGLGNSLLALGRNEGASERFRQALALRPEFAEAHNGLGNALTRLEQYETAGAHFKQAIQYRPDFVQAFSGWAVALRALGQHQAERACWERVVELEPRSAAAHASLGEAMTALGEHERALACFKRALKLQPDDANFLLWAGLAHGHLGEPDEALKCFGRARQLAPENPLAHFDLSLLLLLRGEYERGWQEYDFGLSTQERLTRFQDLPRWRGEPLNGKSLLVCAEQGLGDEIMFASILPEIIAEAGYCTVECDAKLESIYRRSFPAATIIRRRKVGEAVEEEDLPRIDWQCPVGSLPRYRRNRLEDFPRHAGYLVADPARVAYWKSRLDELGPGHKVGISWRGGLPRTGRDRRSIALADWKPILEQPGIHAISLQYTECSAEITALEQQHGIRVVHWQEAIDDYDETAALVCALDQVVTVQTSIFHLAGALGRPVWGFIPIPAEWRYLQAGSSSPWYPSARLFRQSVRGDWGSVINAISDELRYLSARSNQIPEGEK